MPKEIRAPILRYEAIRKRANLFLKEYNPEGKFPLPIEKIIEFKLGMQIVPARGLIDGYIMDGFLFGLQQVWVDKDMYVKKHPRYYFTLAHEIGHYILHKNLYIENKVADEKEWKQLLDTIPEEELSWFERQANTFGGFILVPLEELEKISKRRLKEITATGVKNKCLILDRLLEFLHKDFRVSRSVVKIRLLREQILPGGLQKELLLNSYQA